jgi:hypothetical protein
MGGTSMATPLTAGAVGLVREFLRKKQAVSNPSASLLKAVLVVGAERLPKIATAGTVADPHQGFGRVNLDSSLRKILAILDGPGLKTGEKSTMTLTVPVGNGHLRVALCYTDFPGESLVNNLNLIMTGPSGKRYVGNQKTTASSNLKLDTTNNVEVIDVPKAKPGKWTIDVVAGNVPSGPQDFSLAAVMI